jgi:hypothetical protein
MKFTKQFIDAALKTHYFPARAAAAENGTIGLKNKIP